ncbi:hypothetical protein ACSFA0_22535 [Variovorax sp. LT1P1]|uniref:hypothetical protein n=1 Tax=Variovorax sp. LT1P1 TaxID=3443730 RepID=UPI003F4475F6
MMEQGGTLNVLLALFRDHAVNVEAKAEQAPDRFGDVDLLPSRDFGQCASQGHLPDHLVAFTGTSPNTAGSSGTLHAHRLPQQRKRVMWGSDPPVEKRREGATDTRDLISWSHASANAQSAWCW